MSLSGENSLTLRQTRFILISPSTPQRFSLPTLLPKPHKVSLKLPSIPQSLSTTSERRHPSRRGTQTVNTLAAPQVSAGSTLLACRVCAGQGVGQPPQPKARAPSSPTGPSPGLAAPAWTLSESLTLCSCTVGAGSSPWADAWSCCTTLLAKAL